MYLYLSIPECTWPCLCLYLTEPVSDCTCIWMSLYLTVPVATCGCTWLPLQQGVTGEVTRAVSTSGLSTGGGGAPTLPGGDTSSFVQENTVSLMFYCLCILGTHKLKIVTVPPIVFLFLFFHTFWDTKAFPLMTTKRNSNLLLNMWFITKILRSLQNC